MLNDSNSTENYYVIMLDMTFKTNEDKKKVLDNAFQNSVNMQFKHLNSLISMD